MLAIVVLLGVVVHLPYLGYAQRPGREAGSRGGDVRTLARTPRGVARALIAARKGWEFG